MITLKSLEILENSLVLTRNVNRAYDDSFAVEGAKIGSTLRIRLPNRYTVRTGAALSAQDITEQQVTLTVSSQVGVDINFTTADLTMKMDDFAERYLKPGLSQVASYIDADVANSYKDIWQSVGTPGTTPGSSLVLLQAQQKLNEAAATMRPRYATVNPAANANLVEGMKGFFNPTGTISRQFKEGMMGEGVLGYDEINMSQSIKTHTSGSRWTSPSIQTTNAGNGSTTLAVQGTGTWQAKAGDVFTVADVYAVNPQTRESTGQLQQFVVTADVNLTTNGNVSVLPAIYASGPLQTVNRVPTASDVITYYGSASSSNPQNLVYHRDAITFATADLVMPRGVDMASRKVHNGISIRIVRQYDINNDRLPCRLDVLYGYKVIRPQMACRIWG